MKRSKIDLQNFPPDLIYLVCETLCHHCPHANTDQYWASEYQWACQPEEKPNRQTLLNLSLLRKSWGCVAQKFLYHHFGILETTLIAEILFCRTISQNPDLAKLVKFARLRNIDTADNASPIEDWIMGPLNKFSEFLDFPGTIFDPEASNWESFVAPLILLQVPNLKHLFVGHKNDYMLFDKFDKPALVRQQALPPYINAVLVGHDNKHPKTVQEIPGPVDFSTEHLENLRWLEITVEGFWDPIDVPSLDEQALVAALPPSLQFVELRVEEHNWKGIIDAIITYLLSAGKQHTLRSCQIVLTSGVMPIVWDEENTLQFRSSLRAIDQRLEEMSDSITDRPKTGKLRTRIYGPSPIPSGSGIPF
ncbi:uncharacterized protein QYS62_005365 [Fusarium acuminatum]|uniref:F-box domain-containing protein n=1 Tax=Fusarium acuminatum TaxID=5515 RepID=A0ABZ2WUA6_9HYPO